MELRPDVRDAVLDCMEHAERCGTQSGRHIAPIATVIVEDMQNAGYDPSSVYLDDRNVTLPGWFRPTKKWDITAFDNDMLVAAIELKSISGSFGNNANNRSEEAIGSVTDIAHAVDHHLLEPNRLPPNFGYALLIRKTADSAARRQHKGVTRYPVDQAFECASYIDRFTIMGRRLLQERIYQAVWVATADLEQGIVEEPDPMMTYSKFITRLKSWIDIVKA